FPRIYPITDTGVSGLSHAEQVRRLIDGGATLIQLREKNGAPKDFIRHAEEALAIAHQNKVRIIINDRVDVALALNADGVHLGQSDMPVEAARKLLGPRSTIGFSTHNLAQIEDAIALPADYIAFGPIFATHTKSDHEPVVGLDQLREIRHRLGDQPLVAIGGITEQNFAGALEAGADSVAVISDLLKEPVKIAEKLARMLASSRG
ncbi:MAG TPA: thiamine phosphate synthase, partial [Pyrinomonadaceae bacterium]|nr:thiamine phosphate synthase [Pyrinomonadaceae bacterium]